MARATSKVFSDNDHLSSSQRPFSGLCNRSLMRLGNRFNDFRKNEAGAILMTVAFMIPLVVGAAGGAVDYMRATLEKNRAQSVLDRTLLGLSSNGVTNGDVSAKGDRIFRSGLTASGAQVDVVSTEFNGQGAASARPSAISGQARVSVRPFFLGILGINEIEVDVSASVAPPRPRPVEVALVLDVSGSMNERFGAGSRMDALQSAVSEMFDILEERVVPYAPLSISVVPYSSAVNIGNVSSGVLDAESIFGNRPPAVGADIWAGERVSGNGGTTFDVSDASPLINPIPFYSADDGVNLARAIPNSRILPLTDRSASYRSAVNGLTPNGFTAAHLGMIWGAYTLSPKWGSVWSSDPQPYDGAEKVIVMLTDGAFNTTVNIGKASTDDGDTANRYFQAACDLAIDNNVAVYTIALSLSPVNAKPLKDCAEGGRGRAVGADSASELTDAFRNIADQLGKLRLSS